jgi:hypothetical protein
MVSSDSTSGDDTVECFEVKAMAHGPRFDLAACSLTCHFRLAADYEAANSLLNPDSRTRNLAKSGATAQENNAIFEAVKRCPNF